MLIEIPNINPPGKTLFVYWENFLTDDEINYILSVNEWNNKNKAIVGGNFDDDTMKKVRVSDVAW